ncbi:3-dehydroquinate synthase [Dyadobacter sandarakinus]|uniref:3-dehydroquinate synthase n=1 Tax=Dyadobacter sandarakinus TaxID=2747268 RepID=A0ABX7IA50_9BACT|nr:3-dehydroquinate synthase [Dyadobacter sandarakinus]QRR02790.1 3-dehydroquinate synthase [Dyadobacter sandarakinus]
MNQSVVIAPVNQSLQDFLSKKGYSSIIVIADNNTKKHCYPRLKASLPKHRLVTVPAGESQKTLATCEQIWEAMTEEELDRHALVINIGGGVIGDMGGFCASVYKRGIDFLQVPTTLLSQVDASVGGKLGIDFQGFKNHLGVFRLPETVLIDPAFLESLPYREVRSGYAEIIKHCLIADAAKWDEIRRKDFEEQDWNDLIAHSVGIKQQVVDQDPTEKGLRKILNFGHTLGHAVETCFLAKPERERLFHGEAIAVGMIMESYLSYARKMIDQDTLTQIEEFLFASFGKVEIRPEEIEQIITLTRQDKKNKGKEIRFSLLERAGKCAYDIPVTPSEMRKSIAYYQGAV